MICLSSQKTIHSTNRPNVFFLSSLPDFEKMLANSLTSLPIKLTRTVSLQIITRCLREASVTPCSISQAVGFYLSLSQH